MKNRIKNHVLDVAARFIYVKEQIDETEYERQIAESQAKIGPYVHHPCPVQIWA